MRSRVASAMPMEEGVKGRPFGATHLGPGRDAAMGERHVGRDHDDARPRPLGDPVVRDVEPLADDDALDQRVACGSIMKLFETTRVFSP